MNKISGVSVRICFFLVLTGFALINGAVINISYSYNNAVKLNGNSVKLTINKNSKIVFEENINNYEKIYLKEKGLYKLTLSDSKYRSDSKIIDITSENESFDMDFKLYKTPYITLDKRYIRPEENVENYTQSDNKKKIPVSIFDNNICRSSFPVNLNLCYQNLKHTDGINIGIGVSNMESVSGIQSTLIGYSEQLTGLQLNYIGGGTEKGHGMQVSGLVSVSETGNLFQISGLTGISLENSNSYQISSLVNYNNNGSGGQSGSINIGNKFTGMQSGLYNYAIKGKFVFQAGVINFNKSYEQSAQTGFLSICSNGKAFQVSAFNIYNSSNTDYKENIQFGIINYSGRNSSGNGLQAGILNIHNDEYRHTQTGIINFSSSDRNGVYIGAINIFKEEYYQNDHKPAGLLNFNYLKPWRSTLINYSDITEYALGINSRGYTSISQVNSSISGVYTVAGFAFKNKFSGFNSAFAIGYYHEMKNYFLEGDIGYSYYDTGKNRHFFRMSPKAGINLKYKLTVYAGYSGEAGREFRNSFSGGIRYAL